MAGGGMRMTTEDMARFIYFVINRGRWEGRQLLEEEWFDLCLHQADRDCRRRGRTRQRMGLRLRIPVLDVGHPDPSVRMAPFGQFGVVLPDKDLFCDPDDGNLSDPGRAGWNF